ncbi:MAG: hypothetical protein AAF383_07800 [Cyanobacteria bacterium P01_A01_bin.83]
MLIQDLQYLENVEPTDEMNVTGAFGSGLIGFFAETGGNFGFGSAESDVLGDNTISESIIDVDVIQGTGSSSSAFGFGIAIPGS